MNKVNMTVALLALAAAPVHAQSSGSKPGVSRKSGARGKATPAPVPTTAPEPPPSTTLAPPPPPEAAAPVNKGPEPERPWAKGVAKRDQERALELFRAGNALLKESIFVQASDKYRQALALWGHPAIHYNLALALMNLDQPIEVHEHLVAALRFGAEPLEAEKFEYARNYKTLIENQLAHVEVVCDQPGAVVMLDNKPLFTAPGRYSGLVRPGAHSVSATLAGYVPSDETRSLLPGETLSLDMKLFTANDLTRYRRRWSAAMPWLVMGAGAALTGGGVLLHLQSRERFNAFDTGINACGGCVPPTPLAAQLNQGNLMQRAAFGGYALGGAALITGAVLAYLNQPESYRIDPNQVDPNPQTQPRVSILPVLGGGSSGVQALLRF
ncbi:hypothetical protein [Archangium primigenium]|uniref:hypothetical protein n=1 Tax=[Archangium] primigenium TaxID=2792470 RepID=UPI0019561768|nr:hypothetical protein [Archangium primigenium]